MMLKCQILFEDYKEALPLYLRLLKIYPNNSNFKYRIGQCYINTPGEKDKAIVILKMLSKISIQNIKKENSKKQELLMMHSITLQMLTGSIISSIKLLKPMSSSGKILTLRFMILIVVNLQIQSCLNAKELMNMPLYVRRKTLEI